MKILTFPCTVSFLTVCCLFSLETVARPMQRVTQPVVSTAGASLPSDAETFAVQALIRRSMRGSDSTETQQGQATPAQSEAAEREVLQQLLKEVRELRLAVQRATVTNTRFQMLIERVRLAQGNVESIGRQLESVRSHLADIRMSKPQFEQQVKDAEALWARSTEVNEYAELESRIKALKAQLARFGPEEERLHQRETTLNFELQTTQLKLNELNGLLDTLMNELKSP